MSLIARIIRCIFALYYEFLVLGWAGRPETMPHSFVERLLLLATLGFRAGAGQNRYVEAQRGMWNRIGKRPACGQDSDSTVCRVTLPEKITTDVGGVWNDDTYAARARPHLT